MHTLFKKRAKGLHNFWQQQKGIAASKPKARRKLVMVFKQRRKDVPQGTFNFMGSSGVRRVGLSPICIVCLHRAVITPPAPNELCRYISKPIK